MYGILLPTNDTKWFHAQLEGTMEGQVVLLFKLLFENSRDIQIKAKNTVDWVGTKPCCSSPVSFEAGTVLDIAIIHTSLLYLIYVNNVYCCDFTNYIPYDYANSFHVHGSIALYEISF
ncbi:hypothetical protein Bpfe_017201 [Biomphalaria pfeifferi]|uniref:Galectin domain-containing protein n=1 Tax=Biomphalaria pfeifferi TaxID=112525 RepID=A0AAD8F6M6_BIOPF|nr:hypothetical protein Bpfe_017201 [Biomphalaria pfeifferi]